MQTRRILYFLLFVGSLLTSSLNAQQADYRPGLFLREDWKEIPAELPVNQTHVANEDTARVRNLLKKVITISLQTIHIISGLDLVREIGW